MNNPDIRFVGVLNITPDSFSDGGLYTAADKALSHATELFAAGASIVDIGAESTNPQSTPLTAKEEIARLKLVLPTLHKKYGSGALSVDTYHPETVAWLIKKDIRPIVNDVSSLHNPAMKQLVIRENLRVIISHLPMSAEGIPTRAHTGPLLDDIEQVQRELLHTAQELEKQGLPRDHIILDPGIGFGKTMRLNWQLLDFPKYAPRYAVMLGYSRKRFLHTDPNTGQNISSAIDLKAHADESPKARHAYEDWLETQHRHAYNLAAASKTSTQLLYLRVHKIPKV